ncbi:MAG: hypothetical protein ABI761_07555 [Saprospiraceae bacterium]
MKWIKALFFSLILMLVISSCKQHIPTIVWDKSFPGIGSQSSPRPIDINHDGTDDLVLGACKNEYQPTDMGVIALDGKSGEVLWQMDAHDQVYGSASIIDINGDKTDDVIIGGRWSYLRAIDGKNGKILWVYLPVDTIDPILKYAKYNFFNSVLVPDQNGDGMKDLLIQNGGNHSAKPQDSIHRYPGVLMLFDSKTGKVLAADTMPDGKESYMSPVFMEQPDGKQWIIFGSGGETFNGHLYAASLSDFKNGSLNKATILASSNTTQGFIAPPVLADINHDQYLDIISISHNSDISAIDGKTFKPIWKLNIPGTESSNSFAVGQFTGDDTPDFFTFVSKGIWPKSQGSLQILIDGQSGKIAYENTLGCAGFSSPVAYDLNQDGLDEVIISINEYDCERGYVDSIGLNITNKLVAINFKNHQVQTIETLNGFKNIFSTPYIGDLDHDGYLDIVHSQFYSPSNDLLVFLGMRIKRIATPIKVKKPVKWGGYMGSKGNGIYE